ncbi:MULTISPECIES: NAD(P)H-dependent glycerol-3-phosphate dehydrogenase [unclassified Bacillus (in: firmicutes)]|uniref:NAD(P)H-dependent glycerol-3-phosphate dehydrogenase n=1 Tax=unclassified Bacillus (in: firmicutes) TaxID=185979 RepID=UPI0008F2E6E3|nr:MULTISPECIES: NAD(P)H-dependent glycerol-3-phosphate dehydrogenase [unclassified Bacillus (in: firmicutes)]SFJ00516.1 glycerol 3-phosphate dehydrogenase (NAD(P)+) [Bacillus sp. 71mf]SFS62509.1 glycerol 3-phosphate dehydrogenase (NAD(P)+) [Bacillus sp. 103mf]
MKKITVVGAGSWGTALAMVLADNGHDVRLWGNRAELMDEMNEKHENSRYLPGVTLPASIVAYSSLEEALVGVDTVLLVVPTKAYREVLQNMKKIVSQPITWIHASKGIEPGTSKRISEVIEEEIPAHLIRDVVVLSGPSHAEEVGLRQATTVTSAAKRMEAAEEVQDLFMNSYFRVYTNPDIIGVELGGALKNIIALAAGITDGLGLGDNAKAALMTRGLTEIARLGSEMGGNPLTFAGLTGMGDLIVTCTSVHSRNWRAGNMLGKGCSLEEVLDSMGMVVEGVRTTKAAYEMAKKMDVEMPITTVLYDVLFNEKNVKDAVGTLMGRVRKHEVEAIPDLL